MTALGRGLDYFDLRFLGQPEIIAAAVLHGASGAAVVDPGPTPCLPTLRAELAARGIALADLRWIVLTHVHLDHAAATGALLRECPDARVIVHERGAAHLVDPSKLIASASRLYGADMERFWGEIVPVPAARLDVIADRARRDIAGHDVDIAATPGHASHHLSYFLREAGVAFVGDTAGMCRPSGRLVLPPTPPPDIDLDAWRESTATILAWDPDVLFLTHYGPHRSPRGHFQELWKRIDEWSARVQASLDAPAAGDPAADGDTEKAAAFAARVMDDITRQASRAEADAYARAGRFDFSWAGLARYWRKKERAHGA